MTTVPSTLCPLARATGRPPPVAWPPSPTAAQRTGAGRLIGAADATVAVPEAAQAVVAAALAAFTERTPLLVVTATGLDADGWATTWPPDRPDDDGAANRRRPGRRRRRGRSRCCRPGRPLPFERVSPETETMGRRLAVLHALTGAPDPSLPAPPRVIVAPVRALLQRLGPLEGTAPSSSARAQQVDVGELLPSWWPWGYRREHQVEHRGEFAVRGGIVDVFPSTADVQYDCAGPWTADGQLNSAIFGSE